MTEFSATVALDRPFSEDAGSDFEDMSGHTSHGEQAVAQENESKVLDTPSETAPEFTYTRANGVVETARSAEEARAKCTKYLGTLPLAKVEAMMRAQARGQAILDAQQKAKTAIDPKRGQRRETDRPTVAKPKPDATRTTASSRPEKLENSTSPVMKAEVQPRVIKKKDIAESITSKQRRHITEMIHSSIRTEAESSRVESKSAKLKKPKKTGLVKHKTSQAKPAGLVKAEKTESQIPTVSKHVVEARIRPAKAFSTAPVQEAAVVSVSLPIGLEGNIDVVPSYDAPKMDEDSEASISGETVAKLAEWIKSPNLEDDAFLEEMAFQNQLVLDSELDEEKTLFIDRETEHGIRNWYDIDLPADTLAVDETQIVYPDELTVDDDGSYRQNEAVDGVIMHNSPEFNDYIEPDAQITESLTTENTEVYNDERAIEVYYQLIGLLDDKVTEVVEQMAGDVIAIETGDNVTAADEYIEPALTALLTDYAPIYRGTATAEAAQGVDDIIEVGRPADEQPLVETFVRLAAHLVERPLVKEAEEIEVAQEPAENFLLYATALLTLRDISELLPETVGVQTDEVLSGLVTPELIQKVLILLDSLGYEDSPAALLEFVSQYGPTAFVRVLQQLANQAVARFDQEEFQLQSKKTAQITSKDSFATRLGQVVFMLVATRPVFAAMPVNVRS